MQYEGGNFLNALIRSKQGIYLEEGTGKKTVKNFYILQHISQYNKKKYINFREIYYKISVKLILLNYYFHIFLGTLSNLALRLYLIHLLISENKTYCHFTDIMWNTQAFQ